MYLVNKDAVRQMMVDSGLPFLEDNVDEGCVFLENMVINHIKKVIAQRATDTQIELALQVLDNDESSTVKLANKPMKLDMEDKFQKLKESMTPKHMKEIEDEFRERVKKSGVYRHPNALK